MTGIVLDQYSPELFNNLPSIEQAEVTFKEVDGLSKIKAELAALADKHRDVVSRFGVQLLHRHCRIDDDEAMIAQGGTTVPIKLGELSEQGRALVKPTFWSLQPGTDDFVPIEFAFQEEHGEAMPALDPELAKDVGAVLKKHHLEHVFGLTLLDADDGLGVESTFGRANIVVPVSLFATQPDSVEVLWALSSFGGSPRQLQVCRRICVKRLNAHRVDHQKE